MRTARFQRIWWLPLLSVLGLASFTACTSRPQPPPAVTMVYEAENLQLTSDDAWAGVQTNCCNVVWSNNAQIFFKATEAGQSASLEFTAPYDDTYQIAVVETQSFDYGNVQFSIDGDQIGTVFYAYSPVVVRSGWITLGSRFLDHGTHRLTLTVVGRSSSSAGFYAGIDEMRLES
jgi:hypothetical protein